eukprot:scaffold84224_cov57-Phaeocystis_antarctica.AAC.3
MSKLSGWLNTFASCRVETSAYDAGRGVRDGRRAGVGRSQCTQRAGEGSTADWGQGTRGGAHPEHGMHVRDAGRVEVQRLVELIRALPSRKEGMRCGAR